MSHAAPSAGSARLPLALLALTIASGAALRIVFSPLQELAKHELALSDLQLSLAQGLAASIPIAILAIPIGRLVDRSNRVRLLVALAATSAIGTMLTATARNFEWLFVARMLAGLGAVCAIPVAISIAADLSAIERRGRALLLLSLGQAIGVALGFALGGWLVGAVASNGGGWLGLTPWRAVHLVFGTGALLLVMPLLALGEPERRETGNLTHPPLATVLGELWTRRGYLVPLFVGQTSVVMADVAAGIWASPVLTRDHGLSPEQFGGWMAMAVLVPGIAGSIIGGIAADLGGRSRRRGGMLIGAIVASVIAVPAALFPLASSLEVFALVLAVLLLCGVVTGLITATVIATIIPNELRGICLGAFVVVSSVIGMGIAPTVVSLVSGALGGESHLAPALAGTGVVISVASLLAFVLAALRLPSTAGDDNE
jgi:MFS family permease